MSQEPELSVVLPTLDESAGLKVLLPRLEALFVKLGVRGEIIVVDGGSKDDTVAVAAARGARVERQRGRGFGSAVREGLHAARAEYVALMDADGSHAPEALEAFWARRAEAELIVGSRYCRGGTATMPLTRQILSRALNMVSRRVLELPVHESSSGFRLYRAGPARAVNSNATDFSIQQDLMVGILAAGGRVIELPIHYAPRVGGASKANAWKLAPAYIRLFLRLKPLRGGWRAEAGLFAALAAALVLGLRGLARPVAPAALCALSFRLGVVWMLFELGRILSGRRAGTVAALAGASTALVLRAEPWPETAAAFFLAATAYCAVRVVEEGRGMDKLLCGLGAALAIVCALAAR
jgi:dolichol-phosphate mannosyltransferase